MARQNLDTPPAELSHLSASALRHRKERVEQLKILVATGLYKVDPASLVRAMMRHRESLPFVVPGGRSLDRQLQAEHLS